MGLRILEALINTMSKISFLNADEKFNIPNRKKLRRFILQMFQEHNMRVKQLDFIVCSDEFLLQINKDYLFHDYYTDIITFVTKQDSYEITSEAYLSLDRIKDNSKIYQVSVLDEVLRVMFHGVLHICGFNDTSVKEKTQIRLKEDYYLKAFESFET